MKKTLFRSFPELRENLKTRVRNAKSPIAVLGGHYALNVSGKPEVDKSGCFGIFPQYTMELASLLVNHGKSLGKETKLVLLVDDHSQMPWRDWYERDGAESAEIQAKTARYFSDFQIPPALSEIMQDHGLSEDDILPDGSALAFQESKFRKLFGARYPEAVVSCAGEYALVLEELARQGVKTLIGFIPDRCQGPTCNAVQKVGGNSGLSIKTVHAYLFCDSELDSPGKFEEEMKNNILVVSSN